MLLAVIGCAAGRPAAAATQVLRLTAIDSTTPGTMRLVAVVPPELAMLKLRSADFTVQQDRSSITPRVTRLADRGLQVVLVPDRGVSRGDIILEQAALIELAHLLPDTINLLTFSDSAGGTLTSNRDGTMRALSALTPARRPSAVNTIAASIFQPPLSTRRVYVLVTTCSPKPAALDEEQLNASLVQQSQQSQQIDVLHIGTACKPPIPSIVRASGGVVVEAANAGELAMAADRVSREMLGQYQLVFPTISAKTQVTVEVAAMQLRSQASVKPSAAVADDKGHGNTRLLVIVLVLIIAIVAGVFVIELVRSRRQID
jgi:hypothetical protein